MTDSENPFAALSGAEKKKLRGRAQTIEAKVQIGRDTALAEIVRQLELVFKHDDLVKARFHTPDRRAIMKLCGEIEAAAGALCVSQVGKAAAFFKPRAPEAR